MDQPTLRKMLRRRLPEDWFQVRTVEISPELAKLGLVACVVMFQPPESVEDGVHGEDGGWARNGEELQKEESREPEEKIRPSSSPQPVSPPELAVVG